MSAHTLNELELSGFGSQRSAVSAPDRARLLHALASCTDGVVRNPAGAVFAARGVLWPIPPLRAALRECGLDALASLALASQAFPIDAVFFDKHAAANWAVPAHQDRLMPVADTPSSQTRQRHGLTYAEPDTQTLSGLVALRIHFDTATAETGALRIFPDTHRQGILSNSDISSKPLGSFMTCAADPGDVILMRPLALHRSTRATTPSRRRVLHVVYATEQPRNGLRWRSAA